MTSKLIPINKVLHCPLCQELSAGLIYPDGALAEWHILKDGGIGSKGIQVGLLIQIPVLLVLFLYIILSQIGVYWGGRSHDNNYV